MKSADLVKRHDKGYRADASQYFIAGELCRRGLVAVVTMGNCPNTDILCSNAAGTRFAHIQVKTFVPGGRTCSVGMKAEHDYGPAFFWVLGGIPEPGSARAFEYYVIPSRVMSRNVREAHDLWAAAPGVRGQAHDAASRIRAVQLPPRKHSNGWSIHRYLNRWDLIARRLRGSDGCGR